MLREDQSWHFGVLPFTGTGHLNPLLDLGQMLTQRGHRVTFFERPKIRERVERADLAFVPICADRPSQAGKPDPCLGLRAELAMLRFNLRRVVQDVEGYLRETPSAIRRAGVDALIVNEIALTGPTVAELLGLPYFIVSTSVPHNCGWSAYPWYSGYRLLPTPVGIAERALLEISALRVRGPVRRALDRYRLRNGLGPVNMMHKSYPFLAQITQLPHCLDFRGTRLPENCHYTGPFAGVGVRQPVEFPWEQLDGRPLAYVSMGTTRNAQGQILRLIAEACSGLDLQLVISLGRRFAVEEFSELPGKPLVVAFAPQLELLRRARIVITHGGPNTVFETLREGKPMVAIPLAHDQPAIAARVASAGAARVLPVMRLSATRIRAAVLEVLMERSYSQAAIALQEQIRATRGAERAAEIIEEGLQWHADQRKQVAARKFEKQVITAV
jgi:zeaxanthin glucosyltransferase